MSAMTDEKLDELREKREQMQRMAKQVIDLMDSENYSKSGFRKMQREYEAILEEFGQHGLALLETVDDLQARLQQRDERMKCILQRAAAAISDDLDNGHEYDALVYIQGLAQGEGSGV